MKIFLVNQYSGNKGDRAVLYAMCRLLKSIYPSSSIVVSTSDEKLWDGYDYYNKESVKFVPWSWDYDNIDSFELYWKILKKFKKYTFTMMRESLMRGVSLGRFLANPKFYGALKQADIVISVGGHHYTTLLSRDLVSGINFDAMTIVPHKKMICFSQSFGPFDFHNPRNKALTKELLSRSILMPRENTSKVELDNFLNGEGFIIPTYESVLSLSDCLTYRPIEKRDDAVGIAIYCTQKRSLEEKESYQNAIAHYCDHVIAKGYSVRFFPMEIKGSAPDDRPFISEIISRVQDKQKCSIFIEDMETLEHLDEVSKCKVFLGHKTHSTIFALATGTPLVALAYHPKTIEFLQQFGLDSNVIDDKKLSENKLISIFDHINADLQQVSALQYGKSKEYSKQISHDLKDVIDKVTNSVPI